MKRALAAAALVAALVVFVVDVSPATAQTDCSGAEQPPPATTSTTNPDDTGASEDALCGTVMDRFLPEAASPGRHPISHYDLGYDAGGIRQAWKKPVGWLMDFIYGIGRWAVGFALWVVGWSQLFMFADKLAQPALDVAARLEARVIGPAGLVPLALTFTALWAMWLAMTNRLVRGFAELAVSGFIGALALVSWSAPSAWMLDSLDAAGRLSTELATITQDTPRDLPSAVQEVFIERTHQLLNWGRLIPLDDPCRATYDAIVANGPWGSSSKPRNAMKDAGCRAEAKWNEEPTGDRMLGVLLVLILLVLACVLLVRLAFEVVMAQFTIVGNLALAGFAFLAGQLPGRGRQAFFKWLASNAVALVRMIAAGLLLSLVMVGIVALLDATKTDTLAVQLGSIDALVIVALVKRKKLMAGASYGAAAMAQRLASAEIGGSGMQRNKVQWAGAVAAGGAGVVAGDIWAQSRRHGASVVHTAQQLRRDHRARQTLEAVKDNKPDTTPVS